MLPPPSTMYTSSGRFLSSVRELPFIFFYIYIQNRIRALYRTDDLLAFSNSEALLPPDYGLTIVRPSSLSLIMSSRTSFADSGSSPEMGSSENNTSGHQVRIKFVDKASGKCKPLIHPLRFSLCHSFFSPSSLST